jgi:spore maturation protein CgeB
MTMQPAVASAPPFASGRFVGAKGSAGLKIVIYGLTISSSWGNGHATTYRALCKALSHRGHQVHFIEKDVQWYRSHRDLPQPDFCKLQLYEAWDHRALRPSEDADVIVVGSYFPDAITASHALFDAGCGPVLFYDIDTPITLAELRSQGRTSYLEPALIPHYAAYLSFTGGNALRALEDEFGSPWAVGFYCSVDPALYMRTEVQDLYRCDLSYLGTYAPDRQPKLMKFLNGAAELFPEARFIVAGPQYPEDTAWCNNVKRLDHVAPPQHPAFYSSSQFTLNLTRADMVAMGFSPSVRLFEAAACGTPILSDAWPGLERFFTPGQEILLPHDEYEVASILQQMPHSEAERIGRAARERILEQHTASHRAIEFESIVERVSRANTQRGSGSSAREWRHHSGASVASRSKG